jgi:broad specificity phosphatase PhoE
VQTAAGIASPHGLRPVLVDALTECDVGQWDGHAWDEIEQTWPEPFARFQADPWTNGYPGGESLTAVYARAAPVLNGMLGEHEGETIAVVSHHVVLRVWLAALLGLPLARARQVRLANASLSVVVRHGMQTSVQLVNDIGHLPEA